MAHHVSCAQHVALNSVGLTSAGENAWQHTQQWQPVRSQAFMSRQCQHSRHATQKLHSGSGPCFSRLPFNTFRPPSHQKILRKTEQLGQRRTPESKCQVETGQEVVESDVLGTQVSRHSRRWAIGSSILKSLPVAAVFWASEVARAADEVEQPLSVISNEDELSNKIIAVFFTLGVIALTILTAGVIYLSLTDFKESREAAKMEALEKRAPKRPSAKPVESKAFSRGRKTFDLLDDINNEEQRKS